MKRTDRRTGTVALVVFCCGMATVHAAIPELKTEQQKLFYFMGTLYGETLQQLKLSDEELVLVMQGARDAATGNAKELDASVYGPKLQGIASERREALLADERPKAQAYLSRMAAEKGATTTATGLVFLQLEAGNGAQPRPDSMVELNYEARLRDGTIFDSSFERGKSVQVPLQRANRCWQEGIAMMTEGASARITCPADLAYADKGIGKVPPGAAVTYEVTLLRIVR